MIDNMFKFESTRCRYRAAPLLKEREAFLAHLYGQHTSLRRLRSISALLVHIVRILKMEVVRVITPLEIREAAYQWTIDAHSIKGKRNKNLQAFHALATRWLRFADLIARPASAETFSDSLLSDFLQYITVERGLSPETIQSYYKRTLCFLIWIREKGVKPIPGSLKTVNDYLITCMNSGYRPTTIASITCALRAFFRYTEVRDPNSTRVSFCVSSPRVFRHTLEPRGPSWEDVRRLLDHDFGSTRAEYRAAAIIRLAGTLRSKTV
jgi:hypothetical protein